MKVFIHASELYTNEGVKKKDGRHVCESDLGRIEDGAIATENGRIVWVGRSEDLPEKCRSGLIEDLKNQKCIVPPFIDCHTHLVFAGDRSGEFARRCAGVSYEQIAKEGGGILTTVNGTRKASVEELLDLARPRLKQVIAYGVQCVEIKSGYGLNLESELNILRAIKLLSQEFKEIKIIPTFLGAHDFPKDQSREDYIFSIKEEMLPKIKEEGLSEICDVFIDSGFFTLEEGKEILNAAIQLGFKTKIHADELVNTEATSLACEMGSLSADHLLKISEESIENLAKSNTTGVLLPGTAFYIKAPFAPARKLIDSGVRVALATDFNPGSCASLSLPIMMTLGALYMGMTKAEILAAVSYNAACALGLQDEFGILERGKPDRFTILPFKTFEESYYQFGWVPGLF